MMVSKAVCANTDCSSYKSRLIRFWDGFSLVQFDLHPHVSKVLACLCVCLKSWQEGTWKWGEYSAPTLSMGWCSIPSTIVQPSGEGKLPTSFIPSPIRFAQFVERKQLLKGEGMHLVDSLAAPADRILDCCFACLICLLPILNIATGICSEKKKQAKCWK